MFYYPYTQNLSNNLAFGSRPREDKYSNYQQLLNGMVADINYLILQKNQTSNNSSIDTYDFDTISRLKYASLGLDFTYKNLSDSTISATTSIASINPLSLYKATRLHDLKFGDKLIAYFNPVESTSFTDELISSINPKLINTKTTSLLKSSKYYKINNRVSLTASFEDDSFLEDDPIAIVIEGYNEFNNLIQDTIQISKNGIYNTTKSFYKLSTILINNFTPLIEDALSADPLLLRPSDYSYDIQFPIYSYDTPALFDSTKIPTWYIENNKLKLKYLVAFKDEDYFAGVKDYEVYNTYTLKNTSNTTITPQAYAVDPYRPYIYITSTDDKIHVFSKYEEYPNQNLLKEANTNTTYISQVIVNHSYNQDGSITLKPKYTNHRIGKYVAQYKFYYTDLTNTYTFNGLNFTQTEPYYLSYNSQDAAGFFVNPVTINPSEGFYLLVFETVYNDLTVDIYKKVIHIGYKKALITLDLPDSISSTDYDCIINKYGNLTLAELNGSDTKNLYELNLLHPYYYYDDEEKELYIPDICSSLSWTDRLGNSQSISSSDLEYHNIFGEIDEFGLLLGLQRKSNIDVKSFYTYLQFHSYNKINGTEAGHSNLLKSLLLDCSSPLYKEIDLPLYQATALGDSYHIFIQDFKLYIKKNNITLLVAELNKITIDNLKTILNAFCTINNHQEIDSISLYQNKIASTLACNNRKDISREQLSQTKSHKCLNANIIEDTIYFSKTDLIKVNNINNLNLTDDRSWYFDSSTQTISFNFIPEKTLTINYSYLDNKFIVYYNAVKPFSYRSYKNLFDEPAFNNTLREDMVTDILNLEQNRWG